MNIPRSSLLDGLWADLLDAQKMLREYAAENSHGATANADHMHRCVAAAGFKTDHALVILSEMRVRGDV